MPIRRPSPTAVPHGAQLARQLGIPANYGPSRHLRRYREAEVSRLVLVGRAADDGQRVRLAPRAAAAWYRMRDAAARDGITLLPLSGFRSVRRQTQNIRRKLAAGQTIADILRYVAAPGYSEHHTGRAIDIGSPDDVSVEEKFGNTAAFRWLRRHAGRFGFHMTYPRRNRHGFGYEPWHWCWHA
jgi:D-alanyl-D-alanine carboxypeptidase